jgi:hypothetical protein
MRISGPVFESASAFARLYSPLNAFPFAVFLMFDQLDFQPLSDARVSELRDYRRLIVDARDSLPTRGSLMLSYRDSKK